MTWVNIIIQCSELNKEKLYFTMNFNLPGLFQSGKPIG